MRLEVTQTDIDEGEQYDSECCPIAISAKRAWKWKCVGVDPDTLYIYGDCGETLARYPLPPEAKAFLSTFDAKGKLFVNPFSFEV